MCPWDPCSCSVVLGHSDLGTVTWVRCQKQELEVSQSLQLLMKNHGAYTGGKQC